MIVSTNRSMEPIDGIQSLELYQLRESIMGRGEFYRNKYGNGGGRGRGRGRGLEDGSSRDIQRGGGWRRDEEERGAAPSAASRRSWPQLASLLQDIHQRNYNAYHDLARNTFTYQDQRSSLTFDLVFDHIQGDPYASPSTAHVHVPASAAGFPTVMYHHSPIRNTALCDYLARRFAEHAHAVGVDATTRTTFLLPTNGLHPRSHTFASK
jgi:hypothetical protein